MDIEIDEAAWTAKGVTFSKAGEYFRFTHPRWKDPILAHIYGTKVHLATDRSVQHKAIAALLGAAET